MEPEAQPRAQERRPPRWSRTSAPWVGVVSLVGLAGLSLLAILVYALQPQGPLDLADRAELALDADAYGPNLRLAERMLGRATRARLADADSLAEALTRGAARRFRLAAAGAETPRALMAANDRAADAYLELGRTHLERGKGGVLGVGRRPAELAAAERMAACVVGIAPTRRRVEINAFVEDLEESLGRAPSGRCP